MGILALLGVIVMLVGWIWLIIVGFKVSTLWGVLNIFFQPITGLIFCIMNKTGWKQFIIMILGVIIAYGAGGAAFMSSYPGVK
jgi:hypothetical protein